MSWRVVRQDDNGNRFLIATALTEDEARQHVRDYEARAHKQMYWAEPENANGAKESRH